MIRQARAEDAPAIAAIWNHTIRDTYFTFTTAEKSPETLATLIQERGPGFLVAVDKGEVLGFATFGPFRNGPGYAHVAEHTIYLSDRAQGRGLGRALMAAVEQAARAAGKSILVGGLSGDNAGTIAFHAALGYVETGRMPGMGRKFDRALDLVLMQKNL